MTTYYEIILSSGHDCTLGASDIYEAGEVHSIKLVARGKGSVGKKLDK